MRELKFRAWTQAGRMMEWDELQELRIHTLFKMCQPEIKLMQFTGLQDNNGKEIYEGDIVYIAGYGNYLCEFPFLELYEAAPENDIGGILGNIYEQPGLTEKSS